MTHAGSEALTDRVAAGEAVPAQRYLGAGDEVVSVKGGSKVARDEEVAVCHVGESALGGRRRVAGTGSGVPGGGGSAAGRPAADAVVHRQALATQRRGDREARAVGDKAVRHSAQGEGRQGSVRFGLAHLTVRSGALLVFFEKT